MNLHNSGREKVDILTINGYMTINRTILRPKDKEEIELLEQLTGSKSVVPLDIAMGLDKLPFKITRAMMLQIAKDGAYADSYADMHEKYKDRLKIDISTDVIRQVTDYVGKIVLSNDKERARAAKASFEKDLKARKKGEKTGGVLYVMIDGAFVFTRDGGEDGKSAWKDCKTAIAFNSQDVTRWQNRNTGQMERRIAKKDIISVIGDKEDFRWHLAALLKRSNAHKLSKVVLICDGAPWIFSLFHELCPHGDRILDLFHLKSHTGAYAAQLYGEGTEKAEKWANYVNKRLEDGEWRDVLDMPEIKKAKDAKGSKKDKGKENLYTYIDNHKEFLDYPTYKKKYEYVGSGPIESTHKTYMQRRLKLSGMRWKIKTGQGVLALRARNEAKKWSEVIKLIDGKKYI